MNLIGNVDFREKALANIDGEYIYDNETLKDLVNRLLISDFEKNTHSFVSIREVQRATKVLRDNPELFIAHHNETKIVSSEYSHSPSFKVPVSPVPSATDWLQLHGDYGIISDLHIPCHHAPSLERFMEDCYKHEIKKFLIVGDLMDGNQFHPRRGSGTQHKRIWQDDAELASKIIGSLLQCFDSGVIISGNHDAWFAQHMRGQISGDWLMDKIFHEYSSQITWSDYEQCDIISGTKHWRAAHGANYSSANPLSVAQKLSAKFQCNIVMGHQHHSCAGRDLSGEYQTICMGGMHDSTKFDYIHMSPKINPDQTRSYVLLKDGYGVHVEPDKVKQWAK